MSCLEGLRITLFGSAGHANPLEAASQSLPASTPAGAETSGVNPDTATKAMHVFLALLGTSALFITVTILMTNYPDISSAVSYSLFGGLGGIAIGGIIYQICMHRKPPKDVAQMPAPAAPPSVPVTAAAPSVNPFDPAPTTVVVVKSAPPPAAVPKPATNALPETATKIMSIFGAILGVCVVGIVITILMTNYPDISSAVSYSLFGGLSAISIAGILYQLCKDKKGSPDAPSASVPPAKPLPTAAAA